MDTYYFNLVVFGENQFMQFEYYERFKKKLLKAKT